MDPKKEPGKGEIYRMHSFALRFGPVAPAPDQAGERRCFDFRFRWINNRYGGKESVCRVSGCRTGLGRILLLEDMAQNLGPSVTAGMNDLVPALMKHLGLESFEDALWLKLCHTTGGPRVFRLREWPDGLYGAAGAGAEFPMELLSDLLQEDAWHRKEGA